MRKIMLGILAAALAVMPLSGSSAHEASIGHLRTSSLKLSQRRRSPATRLIRHNTQIIPGSGLWVVASLRLHL